MKARLIFIIIIFIGGCDTTSKVNTINIVSEDNKDVFILSSLIRDYLQDARNTGIKYQEDLNLEKLVQYDSLRRISNYFEKIELKYQKGHISVYYQFSDSTGNKNIELTDKEIAEIQYVKWKVHDSIEQYDGEIQFNFGERFYRISKIIIKK